MSAIADYVVCYKEESEYFGRHFEPVIKAVVRANDVCFGLVRAAQRKSQAEEENILWMLAASCLNEFEDIFLLAGNGRGLGATKLLRAFYERVVTFSADSGRRRTAFRGEGEQAFRTDPEHDSGMKANRIPGGSRTLFAQPRNPVRLAPK